METTEKESNNEITKTKLANGINVITTVTLIDKNAVPYEQALAIQKARRLFNQWFIEAETKIKRKKQETD
ncbi:MAG TPA: hypothetical protein VF644_02775 [Pyrinomonadaceae bacterium]|jgi:hypothetical protein